MVPLPSTSKATYSQTWAMPKPELWTPPSDSLLLCKGGVREPQHFVGAFSDSRSLRKLILSRSALFWSGCSTLLLQWGHSVKFQAAYAPCRLLVTPK
jgi:hypothetical protein